MMGRAAAAVTALALAGCVSVDETPPPPQKPAAAVPPPVAQPAPPPIVRPVAPPKSERAVVEPKASEVDTLLADFERLRRITPAELAREQEAARLAYVQSKTDATRVRLAMALTAPGGPPGEEARALELLDPLVRNASAPLHGIAFLLSAMIHEQRRAGAQLQGLQQANQALTQNNQALQQNLHGLQQKLDALRTLERSLSERGEPAPRRR